ncbi:MAG: diaminopropionate ammonia-lyase [Proteobacteria bacterium]|nr:diaminopropionate ammonia-lyase [Pseudomonadota bacterium]MBI3496155.1 diaminopropionate ammonia-lyase [Pseudomonadota bacterium]
MSRVLQQFPVGLCRNTRAAPGSAYGEAERAILNRAEGAAARRIIEAWPGYRATPLYSLPGLAAAIGIAELWYKDEAGRFGLGSFKALGGAYAVYRLLAAKIADGIGRIPSAAELLSGQYRAMTGDIVVTSATDGNHGRSVAWGAQQFGCRAVIYIHATVSEGRCRAIAGYGAEVVRIAGNYDDSVHHCAAEAVRRGWQVVSDTSYEGYRDVPRMVMQGYSVMAAEAVDELGAGIKPSHVFLQGGVGGLAAAVVAELWEAWGKDRPRFIVVEPERADCLYQSALAGRPTKSEGDLETLMAGLAAGEVSLLAWDILKRGAEFFMIIPDAAAVAAMRLLAAGVGGDAPVVGGEAGVGGLAGVLAAAADHPTREAIGLDGASRVMVFGSEGATDPELYRRIVGRSPQAVG